MFKPPSVFVGIRFIRKLINAAISGASFSTKAHDQHFIRHTKPAVSAQRRTSSDAGKVAVVLTCICLGLVSVGVVVGVTLLVKIAQMKADITRTAHELATTKERLSQLEKASRPTATEATSDKTTEKNPLQPLPLVLSASEIKIIRQTIKMPPPQVDEPSKIAVGDEIPGVAARPIPESLVIALPQLRGTSFSIDQTGAIIIIGAGSNRVEAVIEYR